MEQFLEMLNLNALPKTCYSGKAAFRGQVISSWHLSAYRHIYQFSKNTKSL